MSLQRKPTAMGWGARELEDSLGSSQGANSSPDTKLPSASNTVHRVRAAVEANTSDPVAPAARGRSGTMLGLAPETASGPVVPAELAGDRSPTLYDDAASASAREDFELMTAAFGILVDAGIDSSLADKIVKGEVVDTERMPVGQMLRTLGFDDGTLMAVVRGWRLQKLPSRQIPVTPPSTGAVPVVVDEAPVVVDDDLVEEMSVLTSSRGTDRRLIAAVFLGLGLAGAGALYAVKSIVDNVHPTTHQSRR